MLQQKLISSVGVVLLLCFGFWFGFFSNAFQLRSSLVYGSAAVLRPEELSWLHVRAAGLFLFSAMHSGCWVAAGGCSLLSYHFIISQLRIVANDDALT